MALQNIKTYFESANTNDFNELLDQPLVVSEKVQASSFHVKRLKDGQFIGEMSFLTEKPATATCKVKHDTECLVWEQRTFNLDLIIFQLRRLSH